MARTGGAAVIKETHYWVRDYKAVEYVQSKGFETFTYNTLRHYAYNTDLLPRPKKVGKYAYYLLSDLDALIEAL